MRKITLVLAVGALLLLATSAVSAQTALKIGVFDPQRISEETIEGKRAAAELSAIRDAKQQEIVAMEQALNQLQEQFAAQALSLSIDRRAALQVEIQRKQLELQNSRELAFRELQIEIEAAEGKFNEKLRVSVSEFGRAGNFTVILDAGAVAWASAAVDVTTNVIDQFDKMYPAKTE